MLLALVPSAESFGIDEPFMQLDLPLSVLDYLGYSERTNGFAGRSFFRSYAEPREFAFGDIYLRSLSGVDREGRLFVCMERLQDCARFELESGKLFSPARRPVRGSDGDLAFLQRIASTSLVSTAGGNGEQP